MFTPTVKFLSLELNFICFVFKKIYIGECGDWIYDLAFTMIIQNFIKCHNHKVEMASP